MIHVVPIDKVTMDHEPQPSFVRKMEAVLRKQGQIEPLAVDANYTTFRSEAWAVEIVQAARNLGWPTLLVAVLVTPEELDELNN
jgi:hypothetical protein